MFFNESNETLSKAVNGYENIASRIKKCNKSKK